MWTVLRCLPLEWRAAGGRRRVPEPMVMDDPESVAQFHAGGMLAGMRSVYDFHARQLNELLPEHGHLLDLGVGSGQALAFLALRRPDITAVGVDLSPVMLARARTLMAELGLADRVRLVEADIGTAADLASDTPPDVVSSLWTLHQLPDDATAGAALRQMAGLRADHGSGVWILDFQRLRDPRTFPTMLAVGEPDYPPLLRRDAIASEAAAFTVEELRGRLGRSGLEALRWGVSRPLPFLQAHWSPPRRSGTPGRHRWREVQVDRRSRVRAGLIRRTFTAAPARRPSALRA